jgi:hypothetical protein
MTLKAPARMPSARLRAFMSEAPRQSQPSAGQEDALPRIHWWK